MTCSKCKHWYWHKPDDTKAECRRFPPAPGGVIMAKGLGGPEPMILWANPQTTHDFVCGEFNPEVTQ